MACTVSLALPALQGAGGVGGLLSVVRGDAPYFAGYDANGNVTDYVSANGTTVAHYEFGPFGNTTAATGSMADAFAHRFSTKYWDSETGLYYYGHRFYRPELGRWMSRDPIGEGGGVNLLAALNNDAIVWTDALGLHENNTVFTAISPLSTVSPPKANVVSNVPATINPTTGGGLVGGGQNTYERVSTGLPGEPQRAPESTAGTASSLIRVSLCIGGYCPVTGDLDAGPLLPAAGEAWTGSIEDPSIPVGTSCRAANRCSVTCVNFCGTWRRRWDDGAMFGTILAGSDGKRYCSISSSARIDAADRCANGGRKKCAEGPP